MIHVLDDGTHVISSRGMWLPGNYDSDQSARYAFRFRNEVLQELQERICHKDGENRAITMDDLRAARAGLAAMEQFEAAAERLVTDPGTSPGELEIIAGNLVGLAKSAELDGGYDSRPQHTQALGPSAGHSSKA